jgi:Domain of unknown function (DUF4157)/HNH/ENDO VII superfamily nuclease with conserved GHE residues
MKTSAEKSSTTTPVAATKAASRPFFAKAGGGDFFAPAVQMKMAVSKPGEKLEQEADRMADKVMRMPLPVSLSPGKEEKLQRAPDEKLQKKEEEKIQKAAAPEENVQKKEDDKLQKAEEKLQKKEEEKLQKAPASEEKLQRKGSDSAPTVSTNLQSAIQSRSGGGQPLSSDLRGYMEPRFNADFSKVRVHSDQESAALSNQLSARAFTHQNNIFFSRDQYQPGSSEGRQLLAHELTHTIQQGHAVQRKVGVPVPEKQDAATPKIQPAPAVAGNQMSASSGIVVLSSNTFNPSEKVRDEIEAQGSKGLDVRVMVKGLTGEGRVKIKVDKSKNYDSLGKGSMPLLNAWGEQLGGLYINFKVTNSAVSGGYASLKPRGGNTNEWLEAVQKNSALLGGLGLKVGNLPTPVNRFDNGKLTLGVTNLKVEIGGVVDSLLNVSLENTNKPKIDATADITVKGIAKGQLKLDNTKDSLTGKVSLAIEYKSFSGTADVAYNADGTVDIGGKASYNANKLSGEIQFVATDLTAANSFAKNAISAAGGKENVQNAAAPAPVPAPKLNQKQRALAATGQLGFNLTTWFAGTVNVVVDGKGAITVIGKITPPAEIELFKQRDWDKQLIKFEAKAYYGIPLVGNLNLFANISLHALAKLGPAKLYNIEILGTYSTDPEIQKNIQISGSINISAYAGLRLRAEGGAGVEIVAHNIKFGIGLNADIGVKAYADARPTIGYRDPGIFYVSGTLEMVAQPMLGLGGDFFIQLESPWWSPVPNDKWTWPLFSKEWPLTDPIGLSATVKDYVLGSGVAPEIELKKPEFDPSKFMTSMVDKTLPEKTGGPGAGQGTFKEDGSVPKPTVPPKKAAPKKADVKQGKKGTPPSGGKSRNPDKNAAAAQDANKTLKSSLEGLKNKAPYSKAELDKALSSIKGKVKGVSFSVQAQGEKWAVTPGGGGKKKSDGKIELAMKKDGAISDVAKKGIEALEQVTQGYSSKGATLEEMTTAVKSVRRKFGFKSLEVEQKDGFWYFDYEINPKAKKKGPKNGSNVNGHKPDVIVGSMLKARYRIGMFRAVVTKIDDVSIQITHRFRAKKFNDPEQKNSFPQFNQKLKTSEILKINETREYWLNNRPSYQSGLVEKVWLNALKKGNGKVKDPNTGAEIIWVVGQPRTGVWDMGHIPGKKYSDSVDAMLVGTISEEEFLADYQNSNYYRPETPSANRSNLYS